MQAGRELDELVAIHVMGLQDIWQPFMPSTDIHDSWVVVEKMKPLVFDLHWSYRRKKEEEWACIFTKGVGLGVTHYKIYAETAPHAICLAALKAVGVDIEKAE